MSDEFERAELSDRAVMQRKPAEFQEAPGESEAEAARDAFLKTAGPDPAGQATALGHVDSRMRARAVNRLQEDRGNAYVQRVVAEARGTPGRLVGQSQPEMVDEVEQRKGSGSPLPEGARAQMQGQFGADLREVRVHTDGEAKVLNQELEAQAFTVGNDIFFDEGKFDSHSREGQGLLAHELTHVGQQTGFGAGAVQREAAAEEDEKAAQAPAPAPDKKPEEEAPA